MVCINVVPYIYTIYYKYYFSLIVTEKNSKGSNQIIDIHEKCSYDIILGLTYLISIYIKR